MPPIIDAQVHAYERDSPSRPWVDTIPGPPAVTGADMVRAMVAVGVDAALLVSPWSLYRDDPSYVREVGSTYPGRFGLVAPVDPAKADLAARLESWVDTPGAVGLRIMAAPQSDFGARHPGVRKVMATAARQGWPVCVYCTGRLSIMAELAREYPDVRLLVDHLGLPQPMRPPVPAEPFAGLPDLLALARFDNVAVKISGACTLSRQGFPFDDLWPPLERVYRAFGIERCMWGTDWTRAVDLVSYSDEVAAFRDRAPLSAGERAMLLGGTLQAIYNWRPQCEV